MQAALRLVARFHGRDLLDVGKPGADAEARAHQAVPREAPVVGLEVALVFPEIALVAALQVALGAEETGDLDPLAVRLADERAPDVHAPDVGRVHRVGRGACSLHGLLQVAIARSAPVRAHDDRLGLGLPAPDVGAEVVEEAQGRGVLVATVDQHARADGVRVEHVPASREVVVRGQAKLDVDAGLRVVVVAVEPRVAEGERGVRPQFELAAPPAVAPDAKPRFATPGGMARVATQLDVGRAPRGAHARRDANVESGLAHRLLFEPVRNAVFVVAVEALGDERIEAPGVHLRLQARASAVQVAVVAFVEVDRIEAARRARAAVRRALLAPGVADGGAAGRECVDVRVALRRDRSGGEGER